MNQTFTNITLEELIDNTEFIDWVRQDLNAHEWSTWLIDQNSEVQNKFRMARQMILSLSESSSVDHMNTQAIEKLWNRINTTIVKNTDVDRSNERKKPSRVIRMLAPIVSIAATIALIFIINNRSANNLQTFSAEESPLVVTLPSSSTIDLATDSEINYDKTNWDEERRVELSGTATFNVSKGVPFIVNTDNGRIEVLGTSFTVSQEDESFVVNVTSGKVSVQSGPDKEILTRGMAYLNNPSTSQFVGYMTDDYNFVRYQNVRMQEVLDGLTMHYGLTFTGMEAERDRPVTLFYETESVASALNQVFFPVNWKYEIRGKTVIIS